VPRFYFDLFNDITTVDEEGLDLPDEAAARKQAWTAAAQLIADQLAAGERLNPNHRIEVRDDQGRAAYTLYYRDLVEPEESAGPSA
jgi:hypothetical protein